MPNTESAPICTVAVKSAEVRVEAEAWRIVIAIDAVLPEPAVVAAVAVTVSAAVSTTRVVLPNVASASPAGSLIGSVGGPSVTVSVDPVGVPVIVPDPSARPRELRNWSAFAESV